ncbi:hypothetical protein A2U01_0087500, partial [Trifolium medium]|nr:hypothetical protein [Trifolium medium]
MSPLWFPWVLPAVSLRLLAVLQARMAHGTCSLARLRSPRQIVRRVGLAH